MLMLVSAGVQRITQQMFGWLTYISQPLGWTFSWWTYCFF